MSLVMGIKTANETATLVMGIKIMSSCYADWKMDSKSSEANCL